MRERSGYDELHDKYHKTLTTKSGTRYERLAAVVFKALDERHIVIHDLKLVCEEGLLRIEAPPYFLRNSDIPADPSQYPRFLGGGYVRQGLELAIP